MKSRFTIILATILFMWPTAVLSIDWRELDPFDENSAAGQGIQSLKSADAGEWGYKTFPLLADEIYQNNRMEKEAYRAQAEFRSWLCSQEGWSCD